ncbi:Fe-S cluster assembly protein SufD [Acidomonas methanolica]|uniref:Iron-sulfur (Fe-S) assembly protein SufD n=1 Tax=Acidomonas methanolica NBRC 104435 TaxID=1231351 RepID=A0A023D5R3_ACIMT|nr:Fe-S cluster assembly protein SufD [Acidomonas methanolica]MBU2653149.1 Fe-S cluster assembly protein SufD [Acidomonas methanolica]TCS32098.1 iron-regulated ABC transporter permease protein SufD [Acidomonas methanolica]GAJ29424.1 iron-sulfur (Fe-S) assembly protein SufD [Acidomonas methanolica NBRC 104435]GBQ58312.1 iron-sulfur assembly protein SufD [Acidomonas methanolica]GEK97531.1 Fe-S cluster assembly protein SufD [Acidomonas methanolica NBRC 104435]
MNALTSFLTRASDTGSAAILRSEGLPHRRMEAWRYTSLRALDEIAFGDAPALDETAARALFDELAACDGPRIVFVNGVYSAALSELPVTDNGTSDPGTSIVTIGRAPSGDSLAHPLTVLNAALRREGVTIHVPDGVDAGVISLINLGAETETGAFSTHLHHEIVLGEQSRLVLREISAGRGVYLSNPWMSVSVASGGALTHVKLQEEDDTAFHLALVTAQVAAGGAYDGFTLTLGARLARHEVCASLDGEHAAVHVNAAQLLGGTRHADLTSLITHAAPHCDSRQTVKNVVTDAAHAVFQGKICVDRVAQKTDGYQMNQALLLSERAQIDSKPELEIYADDVKCSHGATVGALDEDQLFYLRSRGIPVDQARAILVRAFLQDAIELVTDDALRDWLDSRVARWWARRDA